MVKKSNKPLPLITIVLPVYNEELFLRETLESILAQDYQNVEILVSDNHSSDATASICLKYASGDTRIQFFEQPSNIGAIANCMFLVNKAQGKYLIFVAGHDKWSTNYLHSNVRALEGRPSAVISYGTPCWINENGAPFDRFSGWYDTVGLPVVSRFFFSLWGKPNPILGLIRRNKLPDLAGYNFVGYDNVLLCLLALEGEFIHTVSATFFRRQNRQLETHGERMERYGSDESKINSSVLTAFFPLIRMPVELVKTVLLSSVSWVDKLMILALLLPTMPVKYFTEKNASRKRSFSTNE